MLLVSSIWLPLHFIHRTDICNVAICSTFVPSFTSESVFDSTRLLPLETVRIYMSDEPEIFLLFDRWRKVTCYQWQRNVGVHTPLVAVKVSHGCGRRGDRGWILVQWPRHKGLFCLHTSDIFIPAAIVPQFSQAVKFVDDVFLHAKE